MQPELQKIFTSLEDQRIQLLEDLKELNNEQLHFHPAGKWSILQILAHILAAEKISLQYVQKKVNAVATVSDTGLLEEVKMLVLKWSQRLPGLKFKAPAIVVQVTETYPDLLALEKDWQMHREAWKVFLDSIKKEHLRRRIYRHVVAGRLNIQHAALFLGEHIRHHQPQIKRLRHTVS